MTQIFTRADLQAALNIPAFDAEAALLAMLPTPRPTRRGDKPGFPRQAAVMLLLYPVDGVLYFPLMRRPEYPGVHSGQISLPGGSREGYESPLENAIRELCEEFGICDGVNTTVEILGELTTVYIPPSDFEVHPTIGYLPERPTFKADPVEVAEIIEVPLGLLFDPDAKGHESMFRPESNMTLEVHYYKVGEYKVWGATAAILSELEHRLRQIT